MKVYNDNLSLRNFDAWSGAVDTNYTIIHNLKRMGIITDAECQRLCQQTPTNI